MAQAFVFIDGGNFYFKLKELIAKLDGKYSLLDFQYYRFAEWLVRPHTLVGVRYYIAALKQQGDEKATQLYADQQKLLAKLQQQNI
jgi:hypothetical protein